MYCFKLWFWILPSQIVKAWLCFFLFTSVWCAFEYLWFSFLFKNLLGKKIIGVQFIYNVVSVSGIVVVVVQARSCVWLFAIPWTSAHQVLLSLTISWSSPKFMSIASVMPSRHLILWSPLLLLPSIFPSLRGFSSESAIHIMWTKYWSFSISPSTENSELISLTIDWFDLLAVQGNFMSFLQHHSLKAKIHWCSAFFTVQLSQLYVTTGKTIALYRPL